MKRRDFIKSLLAAGATAYIGIDIISPCRTSKEDLKYTETDWFKPPNQLLRVKYFTVQHPTDREKSLIIPVTVDSFCEGDELEALYKERKKEAINELFDFYNDLLKGLP